MRILLMLAALAIALGCAPKNPCEQKCDEALEKAEEAARKLQVGTDIALEAAEKAHEICMKAAADCPE